MTGPGYGNETGRRNRGGVAAPQRSGRLADLREAWSASLWPLPVLAVAVALMAGVLVPEVDAAVDDVLPEGVASLLFGGGPDAARTVLSAVSGSLITVTSLTFSLTVVTLQLASSQFSPRLLRTFSSDRFVHVTLALFLATFVYSLVVLRTVRDDTGSQAGVVPRIAITLAVVLTVASVVALVLFLAHLARQIRVETMLEEVERDALATIERVLPERPPAAEPVPATPDVPSRAVPVVVDGSGFLASVEEGSLLDAAVAADAVVWLQTLPGTQVVRGTPVGRTAFVEVGREDPQARRELHRCVAGAVHTGTERTSAQDAAFGLRQMVDVASKALSPGVNDPTTAVHALGHLSSVLCGLAVRQLGPKVLLDDAGRVRVVLNRPSFADLLDLAVAQPRRYGSDAPDVLLRLAQLLREVGWLAQDDDQRTAVADQRDRLRATITGGELAEVERTSLLAAVDTIGDALAGRW